MSKINISIKIDDNSLLQFESGDELLVGTIIISINNNRITGPEPKREYVLAICQDLLRSVPIVLNSSSQTIYFKESPPYELRLKPDYDSLRINCVYTPTNKPVCDAVSSNGVVIGIKLFVDEVIKTAESLCDQLTKVRDISSSSNLQELESLIKQAKQARHTT